MSQSGFVLLTMSVVAGGLLGAIAFFYRQELDRARTAVRAGSLIADTRAGQIEYADNGVGAPLLSIHGAGGGFDQGLANAADLVDEGFRVIAPSRFGYLRTPVPHDASASAQADAHDALLSALNISSAIVVGISAGARSAIELAVRHPSKVAALILISPGTYSPTSPVSIDVARGSKFTFWLVNRGADFVWWLIERLAPSVLIRFVGVRPDLVAASSKADQDRVMSIIRSIEPLSLRFPGINVDSVAQLKEQALDRILAPTLIISARDDGFNTLPAAQFAAAGIGDAKLVIYDTGGHLLVGHQDAVRAEVRLFLTEARNRTRLIDPRSEQTLT
ncbi:pimeloyl-ACP methyl ester carboxylesterase [Bradyrhizobium sp. cir1]|uniref:alpha/beta fold hydrolase n=1 Tax=Bradyrhizobium sp. cir1 TaxID=1445730 RepID=UPI0016060C34|nr:alpha/beta fold hydrolase [Bradyrhizobium sp. cir1]MBB4371156.1 pimeloyl-ACP methyl ester carboxylesterase [Bradyrhizobium sp. cir1]